MTGRHYKLMPSAYCKYKEQRSETIYHLERPLFLLASDVFGSE